MVKGTSRRVIVVDSPDPNLFEQAIFIVKNDVFSQEGGYLPAGPWGGVPDRPQLRRRPDREAAPVAARPPVVLADRRRSRSRGRGAAAVDPVAKKTV